MYDTEQLGIPTEVQNLTADDAIYQMIADGDIKSWVSFITDLCSPY